MFQMKPQRLLFILCLCGISFAAVVAETPAIWLDVPFIKQEKEGCGAASIAMVMQYWQQKRAEPGGSASDADIIQHALYSSKEHGIRASDMVRYFQQHGYRTFAFAGQWDDFQQHLAKGRPLIVALKPSGLDPSLHYVVVVGIDPGQNLVFLNDAAQRKLLKQERREFEKQWSAVEHWTLLALPQ
jgi:ABC-type bacteriocin/lantibiotic exporter with double-glycine peptidase domain